MVANASGRPAGQQQQDSRTIKSDGAVSLQDFHSRIAELSRKRRFGDALKEFYKIRTSGQQPSEVSYLQIVNACARAGQASKGLYFRKLCHQQFSHVLSARTEESMCSSLVKGFSSQFKLQDAYKTIFDYANSGKQVRYPNSRIVNHFLRGALRAGAVHEALNFFAFMSQSKPCSLDFTSLSLLVEMLCYAGQGELAECIYSATLNADCARPWANTSMALAAKLRAIVLLDAAGLKSDVRTKEAEKLLTKLKKISEEVSEEPSEASQNMFLQHKLSELGALLNFPTKATNAQASTKFIYFSPIPAPSSISRVFGPLESAVWGSRYIGWMAPYASNNAVWNSPESPTLPSWEGLDTISPHLIKNAKEIRKCVKKTMKEINQNLKSPLIVELGCGNGEWIVELAAASPDSTFIANELRWNRCHAIAKNCQNKALSNIIILGGDGTNILDNAIPGASVTSIYLNFPEPPHVKDASDTWICSKFFDAIYKSLIPGGEFTMISDDKSFMSYVSGVLVKPLCARIIEGAQPSTLKFECLSVTSPWHYKEAVAADLQFAGVSYFDRLWERGSKASRYIMKLRKLIDDDDALHPAEDS